MEFDLLNRDGVVTISPNGRIDSATSGEFSSFIGENFKEESKKLILNFENVDFISSVGLRIIVSVYKNLCGREMQIINANTAVEEVFRLSGIMKIISVNKE